MKTALVIGCQGQDGRYLVQHLAARQYRVGGVHRGPRGDFLFEDLSIDIQSNSEVTKLLGSFQPDEVYYLAAFHHSSEELPLDTHELIQRSFEINVLALNNVLHGIVTESSHSRLFYAASSHVFGNPSESVQDESTAIQPVDAYGISKTAGLYLCRYYRDQWRAYCSVGILYNHESPLRSGAFVSRKVVRAAVKINRGLQDKLVIGDLDAMVDWGYAPDYVDAMWRILQLNESAEFVISSGSLHSVRDLVQTAFEAVGLEWAAHVEVDQNITRKRRGTFLQGNSARLRNETGWSPSTSFREMILELVKAEMNQEL